jgi:hypothetical protein
MNLDKYVKKHKLYIKLRNRMDDIYSEIRKLPLVELKEPYQKGWVIKFELREDIKRRDDAGIIQKVVNMSFYEGYTNKVDQVKAIRRGERKVLNKRGNWVDLIPHRRGLSEKEYQSLTPQEQKYFSLDTLNDRYTKWGYKSYIGRIPAYYLVLKARPNIITHVRLKGGELEAEYEQIRHRLYWSGEFQEFYVGYSGSYPKHYGRSQTRDKIRKFLKGEIDDIYNDRVGKDYDY